MARGRLLIFVLLFRSQFLDDFYQSPKINIFVE